MGGLGYGSRATSRPRVRVQLKRLPLQCDSPSGYSDCFVLRTPTIQSKYPLLQISLICVYLGIECLDCVGAVDQDISPCVVGDKYGVVISVLRDVGKDIGLIQMA